MKQHLAELLRHYPQLKILTGDAAFVMRPLLEVLKEHKVDYMFQVKGNQPEVHEAIEATFAERDQEHPAAESYAKEYAKKCRIVRRRLWIDTSNASWIGKVLGVPNCRCVICVERSEKREDGTWSCEVHYYICSLDFSTWNPMDVLVLVRKHWSIENCLHLIKDRWWDDDRHYLRRPGLGEVWECLLNRSLGVLRLLGERGTSLTELSERILHHPKKCLKRLGFLN